MIFQCTNSPILYVSFWTVAKAPDGTYFKIYGHRDYKILANDDIELWIRKPWERNLTTSKYSKNRNKYLIQNSNKWVWDVISKAFSHIKFAQTPVIRQTSCSMLILDLCFVDKLFLLHLQRKYNYQTISCRFANFRGVFCLIWSLKRNLQVWRAFAL